MENNSNSAAKTKILLSIYQWSFGGYMGPHLVIYDDGLVLRKVYDDIDEGFDNPKIKSTVISSEELEAIRDKILNKIDKREKDRTIYDLSQNITDQPAVDIMWNVSVEKHLRIKGCSIRKDKIVYNKDRNSIFSHKYSKQDKVPEDLKQCMNYLCEYEFSDLQENDSIKAEIESNFLSFIFPYR